METKRRSIIRNVSGSPIIPIEGTFHSNSNINSQLSNSSRRSITDQTQYYNSVKHVKGELAPTVNSSSMIKILLIGDAGVGKSALIVRYCDDYFNESVSKSTVGVDLKVKLVSVDNKFFKTVIWDTAGQERYRNLIPSLYKGTNGVLLTYDVTDYQSFEGLYHWIKECYDNCDLSRTIFYIVGNKLDQHEKKVNKDDIRKLLKFVKDNYKGFKINAIFEVSAKYSGFVMGLFDNIIKDLVEHRCYFDEQRLRNKRSIDLSTARDDQHANCCSY
ncbi:Ras-related protein [Wickerhamomyces ciferrii]|uniref:Ras-related protein n=1 Tax=Wickerhamomyces ciferrii (strain ATCC 14091 / BCRC 22168 / CBS 111 / JCM 3599 / NBRC 0793 / NRRL Y-1031 F-60-10) TaxID=1206466 RepID=K0KXA2_WICCF|nr:Ras-related protein [Wickerhamomyces ciferrii]CCH46667.1 Ras-related protein [Wickerhamomyces ciferrii]